MKAICPQCKHSFPVPVQFVGRSVKCPQCREVMEISRPPKSRLVKFLQGAVVSVAGAGLLGFSCWLLLRAPESEKIQQAVTDAKAQVTNERRIEQQKTEEIIAALQAEADEATAKNQAAEEEIKHLQETLNFVAEQLEQKEEQIAIMMEELGELNESVADEAERKRQKQQSNLAQALDKGSDVWSLAGMNGLEVVAELEGIPHDPNITEQQLRNDAEHLLSQNGIEVLSASEILTRPGRPRLVIRVLSLEPEAETDTAVVNIDLDLKQSVFLGRDSTILCVDATTWAKNGWVRVKADNGLTDISKEINNYINEFISDYRTSNPDEIISQEEQPQ